MQLHFLSIVSQKEIMRFPLLFLCLLSVQPLVAEDYPPGTFEYTPRVDLGLRPVVVDRLPERTLNLPAGFKVRFFSGEVNHARFMAFDENDVLHVGNFNTQRSGYWHKDPWRDATVLAMPDFNRDGQADRVYVAADDLQLPHSIAFYKGHMYVADHDEIYKMYDGDGDGYYEQREKLISVPGIMNRPSEHITHTLLFDEQKEKLYLHVGSGCDLCREDDPERATIMQFNTDGTERRIYASGIRNAVGLDLHPITGQLWAAGHGHDREGRSLPPEWVSIILPDTFHGWPFAYAYRSWIDFSDPVYSKEILPITAQDSALVRKMQRPTVLVDAHLGPMGLHFYTHEQFPQRYKNAAFVAFHAGTGSSFDPGYKVSVIFSNPDGTNARIADFMTGFRPDPDKGFYWAQPMGLVTDSEGYLYMSSDLVTPGIFRIEYDPQ